MVDDWHDTTPPASIEAATRLAFEARKHARAADERTLEILAIVHESRELGRAVFTPRAPRARWERIAYVAACAAIVVFVCSWLLVAHEALAALGAR